MAVTMESAVFMGKNYLNNCQSIVNTTDVTLKQMFDISTKLVSEQDEISGLETIGWENHSWKYLSLIGDERIINLQRTKVYVFSDSVLCLGKIFENPESNDAWEQRLGWIKSSQNYRNFVRIDGEPMEFEWNISQDSIRCSSVKKSKVNCTDWERHQRISQEEFYLCRCSTTLLAEQKTMKKNVWQMLDSYLCTQEDLEKDNGHSLVLVLRKSGSLSKKTVYKESGTKLQKGCCWSSLRADVQFSVLRLHCPEVILKAKDMVNCRYTMQPTRKRLRRFLLVACVFYVFCLARCHAVLPCLISGCRIVLCEMHLPEESVATFSLANIFGWGRGLQGIATTATRWECCSVPPLAWLCELRLWSCARCDFIPDLSLTALVARSGAEGNRQHGMPFGGFARKTLVYHSCVAVSPETEPIISSITFDTRVDDTGPSFFRLWENVPLLCRVDQYGFSQYFSSSRTRCWWRVFLHSCSFVPLSSKGWVCKSRGAHERRKFSQRD